MKINYSKNIQQLHFNFICTEIESRDVERQTFWREFKIKTSTFKILKSFLFFDLLPGTFGAEGARLTWPLRPRGFDETWARWTTRVHRPGWSRLWRSSLTVFQRLFLVQSWNVRLQRLCVCLFRPPALMRPELEDQTCWRKK